jgi:hypothetical protein
MVVLGSMALLLGAALPAGGQVEDQGPADGRHRPRVERFCRHVPDHVARIERRLTTINGGADTRGSLAWLEMKQDEVEAAGRENLATMIGHRIAILTEMIDVLELRLEALADAEVFCEQPPPTGSRHRLVY